MPLTSSGPGGLGGGQVTYNPVYREMPIAWQGDTVVGFTPQVCSRKITLEGNYETTSETSIRHASVQLSSLRALLLPQRSG
jgi:hypothetical protein